MLTALALAIGQPTPAAAAEPPRAFAGRVHQQWHGRDGLPQETVEALARGSDGYLWIGTQDGLARFDGTRFVLFHPRTTPALRSRHVQALAAGPDGEIWIGTGRGLHRYRHGRIEPIGAASGLGGAVVRRLLRTRDGTLLVGTASGLVVLEGDRERAVPAGLGGRLEVIGMAESPAGEVVVTTSQGVFDWDGHGLSPRPAPPVPSQWRAVRFDHQGGLWLGGPGGLWRLAAGRFEHVPIAADVLGKFVSELHQDREQNLWVASERGMSRIRLGADGRLEIRSEVSTLRAGDAFAEDHEGGLWIGTWGHGLHRLRAERATAVGVPEGLPGRYALAVLQARDGAMWLGSDGGLLRLAGERRRAWTTADGLAGPSVRALLEDADGTLWIGTNGGLCRLEAERLRCGLPGLPRQDVFALADDGSGGLWVATWKGLDHVADRRAKVLGATRPAGLDPGVTWLLHRAQDGSLWVAGERPGLQRLAEGAVQAFEPPVVPTDSFLSVHEEPDGTLWFGTAGSGLVRFRGGRFDRVDPALGLPDDVIYAIVPDGAGAVWLSSNHGVFRVRLAALSAAADGARAPLQADGIGLADGMPSAECNGTVSPAGLRSGDGRLWFPTTDGVAVIDPDRVAGPRDHPVVIEELLVNQRPVPLAQSTQLPPGWGELQFRFAAICFANPSDARLRYRLEGFDRGWRPVTGEPVARYTNVPPGDYTFRVTAGEPAGPEVAEGSAAALRVTLPPRWFQRAWVPAAAGILALALLAAGIRVNDLRQQTLREALQRAVDEALGKVEILEGLLPICAWCRRVEGDDGHWRQLEAYVTEHSRATFTHGLCPTCAERLEREDEAKDGASIKPGTSDPGD